MSLKFGSLSLLNKVLYAPLAGCSDLPFRQMALKGRRPALVYCEMVKIDAVIRNDPGTFRMLDYKTDMHPIGVQLCGSKPDVAKEAAKIVESLGFDVIDLNCGCPVDKVTKDGSGSGMLKTPERIGEVLSAICGAVKIPVTVKIRAGWDEDHIIASKVTQIAEQAGAQAIAIHGRTRKQAYQGKANWDFIKACKDIAKTIKVIGNGDIFSSSDALEMLRQTGCDAVLAARGTMGQPWIAEDILRALEGEEKKTRNVNMLKEALYEHFDLILNYQPEKQALLDMRRVGCWYLKRLVGVKELRMQINKAASSEEVFKYLDNFEWEPLKFHEEEGE